MIKFAPAKSSIMADKDLNRIKVMLVEKKRSE